MASASVASFLIGGCSPIPARCDGGPTPSAMSGPHAAMPQIRVGSLPFPGPFTLYDTADPSNLGEHSYEGLILPDGDVTDRGIMYTCRGGFLDVAHIRNAIDLTAYVYARVHRALDEGWTCVQFRAHEPSLYQVELNYPAEWWIMSSGERALVVDELAIRLSQRLAHDVLTWHEILTWHGFKNTVIISEKGSAFSYEDLPSHGVGLLVAGCVLRMQGDFDDNVTAVLEEEIALLQPVDEKGLEEAVAAVEGLWWDGVEPLKRNLDVGEADGIIEPWLVADLSCCASATHPPAAFEIPSLNDVHGRSFEGFSIVTIEPRVLEADDIRSRLPHDDNLIVPERDFPILLADIAAEVGHENTAP